MGMTIDHLRVDHRITVLREFTDAAGIVMRAGEGGILRRLECDVVRMEIHLVIEQSAGEVRLTFPLRATTGPRSGHMREFFEMGDDVTSPSVHPALQPVSPAGTFVSPPQEELPRKP